MKSKIKNRMCNELLNCFRKDYSRYENQISFGELDYNKIDNLHKFLKLFRPDAHFVIVDDSITGFLLIYMTFSQNQGFNDIIKMICCLTIHMCMNDMLKNCFELLQY
jgi:hypothetical protein